LIYCTSHSHDNCSISNRFPFPRKKIGHHRCGDSIIAGEGKIGDRRMRELNNNYRKLDATTDVLSFPQHDPSQPMKPFVEMPDGILRLGDIVVSYPEAVREATEDNTMVDDKIIELVLHGLEHLLGNHHEE